MPDNILYSVQLPDGRTTQWSQNQYEKAKDDLFAKYPEASVIRTSAYNPEDTDVSASDKFDIQLPDGRTTQWTQEQFSKAGADLMTKYPDAQIIKTSDMSTQYWEPKAQEAKQRLDEFNAQHGQFMKEYEFNKGLADSLELEGVTQSGEHDFVAANDAQYQPLSRQREQLRKAYYGNPLVAGQFKANAEAAGKLNEEYMARADDADTGADRRDWKRAAKLQDDIRKLYDAPNKYIEELDGSNGFAKFLKDYRAGAGDVFSDKDFWTRGLTEIARNIDLRGIAKKMEEAANASTEGLSEGDVDRILTPGEKAQIMSFYRLAEAQKDRAENISGGYTAGGSFAESLGFMAEFMLSSGLANVAGKALSTSSKGLASWLGRELMSERALNRAIEKGVTVATDFSKMNRGAKAAKLADEIVAKPIVQGLWHTGTQVGTLATISDGLMDTDSNGQLISVGRSVLNGVLDSVVENWSESVGNAFELPFKGIGAIGKRALGNTGFGKWARWFYNTAPTQVLREAGFNGMIGEMAEEWAGNAVRVGLGLMSPEEFKDFASWEQQLEMAASFAPMSLIGLGTSSYSAIRHSKDYDRLAGQVQDILQRQGVDQNDIDVLFRTKFDTPEDIAKKFAPYLRSISMDAQSPTAKEDYKTMLDFAKEVGIKTVVDEMDQMDQADKRNDMREVISGTTGRFWQEFDSPEAKDADGNPLRIQQVRVLEYADGHPVFIIGGGQNVEGQQEALLATVDESGKKGFIKQSDIDSGIADGTIASDREMMLDDYLQQRVDATNRDAEAQRMNEETRKLVGDIRATIETDPSFNMGTEESPVPATVVAMSGAGVHVVFNSPENGQGETDLTWKELGDYLGMPISVKTDAQIEADAANARDEAQRRLKDIQMITPGTEITVRLGEGETAEDVRYPFQQAIMDDGQIMVYYLDENGDSKQVSEEMVVNLPELTELAKAEVPAEAAAAEEPASEESGEVSDDGVPRDFRGNEIPLLKNGEVNRDAFFKNDTEAWARWNDEQNQDGGADSIQTIQAAMAKVSSDLAKAQAEHDKMSSPGDRYAKKGQIEAMNNRLAELQGILDGYAPAEAAVEAEEEAGGTSAEPAQSSSPSERIPKDKKGNMLFEKAPVEDTAASLLELAGNDLKLAMSTARSMNKQVRGDIRKAEKAKVKGDNPVQIIQNTRQKEQKIQEMQARADYWNEVVENLRRRQEAALAAANRAERDLNEPQRLEEAVANYLATLEPNSLDRADFQRELGWGKSEMQAFFRLWAKSGAGRSLNRVAEDMAADDQTGFVPTDATGKKDIQAVRNAIINVMNEVSGPGELKNYTRNANLERLAEMAEFLEAEEARIEEAVEEAEPAQVDNEDMPDFSDMTAEQAETAAQPIIETPAEQPASEEANTVAEQIEAARQEVDTDPTDAQKEAGNYKKGHVTIDGYEISIENPKGSIRRGTDAKGNEWQVEMNNDYGYIRMTEGPDGDHIDVFLSDNPTEGNVFVVDQVNPETGEFDEHKVMYGFPDAESARAAYLANYSEGWQGLGTITEVTKEEFKKWIESSHRKTKPFSEYKSVTPLGAQNEAREPAGTETAEETPEERAERVTNEAIAFATGQTVEEVEAQREAEEQAAETEQPAEAEKAEENEPAAEETATETAPTAEAGQEKAEEGQEKSVEERAAELAASIAEKTRQYNELYSAWLRDASMTSEQTGENQRQRRELEYERRQLESELVSLMLSMSAEQREALRAGASDAMNDALDKVEAKLAETKRISRIASAIQRFQKIIRTKAKALGKLNLYSFTLADENRPAMGGVLHDKGFAVASNTQILIADKESYDKKKEGKLIDKAGKEIKQKYPKWRELIPAESKTAKMNFGELRDFLASVKAQREADWEREKAENRKVDAKKKYVDDTKVLLNIGEDTTIAFKLGLLSSFADTAERFGAKELLYQDARRMVAVKTKKGIAMLMPVMLNLNTEQFDSIEEFARDRAETWSWYSFGENELQKNDAEASKPARQQKTTDEAVAFVTGSTAEDVAAERENERIAKLQKRIAKWKKLLGNTFEVITDINDVRDEQARQEIEKADAAVAAGEPREDNKVSGWFDPTSKKAFIYLPHITSEADLDRSILHEVIAHKGIRGLFNTEADYNRFLDDIWNNIMSDEAKKMELDYVGTDFTSEENRRRAAADEFIAHYAERNTSIVKELDDNVWSRIVEAVKRIIEDMVGQDIWEADVDVVTPFDSILRDSLAEFVKNRPSPARKKAEAKTKAPTRGSKKIEDFGEKIGGARKDMVRSKVNDTAKLSSSDLKTLGNTDKILSAANVIKSFHKGEMDEKTARTFLALGQVAKRKMYGSTLVLLTKYRDLALAWANGQEVKMEITEHDIDVYASQYNERVTSQPNFRERVKQDLEYILNGPFYHYMHTYELMGFPAVERKLGSYVIRVPREDEKGDKRIFVKSSWDAMRGYVFKTEQEAVSWLDKQCPAIVIKEAPGKSEEGEEKAKYGSLDVVKDQYGWYRVKSRLTPGSIFLSKKFSTREAAEKYLEENHVDLEERERQLVSSLLGSNIGSVEREGPDYRGGADVTEDEFQNTFGTRGVEFGNWVPQRERQLYLNKTYDAIMDLAEILGISPKAFTHGGRLALAFGARGKSRALAHYEPMKEVINLTRMSGAGSLAHEWWHSFDNYMSRIPTGSALAFATKTRKTERDEIAEAFKELTIAVQRMDYARRSRNADGGKPYWSQIEEMTARLFESYVYNKFEALGRRSPLLVRKDTLYDEIEDEINKNAWPYPSKEENETIKPYFDRLFAALQEREDEKGNVLLFRRGGTLMGLHNISEDKLTKAIKTGGLANPSAAVIDINTRTHDNFGEISLLMPSSLVDSETGQNAGTYTGDAWSPTYPGTRRIMSEDGNALYQKDLRDLPEGIRSQVALYYSEHLESDRTGAALAWWFLQDTGRTPDVVRIGMEIPAGLREKLSPMLDKGFWEIVEDNGSSRMLEKLIDQFRFYGDEDEVARASKRMEPREGAAEFVKRRLAERNAQIDQYGVALSFVESFFNRNKNRLLHFGEVDMNDTFLKARKYVDQNDLGSEFIDWLQDRDDRYSVETKLFDGYDENGDPRLFDNTVENASMLMNNERETNSYDNGGLSATRSALLKRLRTLSDIRKNRASLSRDIDDEEWKRVEDQLFSIISRLADMQQISDNQFTNIDLAETRLQEALASRNPVSYLNAQYGYRIPSKGEFADDLRQFIEDARALPVKFFEVKFQRPVHLNEFAAAVVPSDISEESRKALTDAGLPIYEYGENMSRQDATMSASEIEGIRFSRAFHGSGADFDAFDHSHVGEGEGLQVHGWGTYVTFDENTGRKYARQVGGSDDQYARAIRSIDNQIDRDKASLARAKNEAERTYYSDAIALAERRRDEMARHLYIVDIPDDTGENYIDEMKTLSKDGRRRIAAVVRELPEDKLDRTLHGPNWLPQGFKTLANVIEREQYAGMEIRQRLEDALGNTHQARKETSSILHQAGFVGMTYDGRQDGPSAVIFDEKDLKITDHIRFRRSPQRPASFTEEQDGEKTTEKPVGVAFTSPEDTGGRLDTDGITDANIQTFFEKAKKTEDKVKIDPSFIGRQLTKDEIATTIEAIERIASPRPTEIPFTRENYDKLFSNGKITPIGKVKMGDGQFEKFVDLGRTNQLAMADETLRNPDLIIEKPSTAREGQKTERPSSFIFVKAFDNPGGKPKAKIIYYNSISAKRDGLEVVMSNYETNRNRVKNDIEKGKLTYVNSVALSSESGNSVQGDQFAIPAGDDFSKSEVTNNSEKNNVSTNKSASHNDTERFRTSKQVIQAIDRKGLADVIGDENVPEYYNNLYRAIPEEIRESVINRLGDTGLDFHRAMRTHLSDLAFNGIQNDESGLLRLAGTMLQDYIDGDVTLSDRALEYIFWRIGKESDLNDSVDIAINTYLRSRAEDEQPSIRFRKGDLAESLEAAGSATESAAQQAQETLDEKKDKLRGDLLTLARAMNAQKEYDKSTVEALANLAKSLMKDQFIDTMNRREIGRLLGLVRTSVGKSPRIVKRNAQVLIDMVIDHLLKREKDGLKKITSITGVRQNASGVSIQGELDVKGQNIMKAYNKGIKSGSVTVKEGIRQIDTTLLDSMIADKQDELDSSNDAVRKQAEADVIGLELAKMYWEGVERSMLEEQVIKDGIKEAKKSFEDGNLSKSALNETIAAAETDIRNVHIENIIRHRELRAKIQQALNGSADAKMEFRDKEKKRIEHIHHLANSDMEGVPTNEPGSDDAFINGAIPQTILGPLFTHVQFFKLLGRKNPYGKGYLYEYYVRKWRAAQDAEYVGMQQAMAILDQKVEEIFGEGKRFSDLFAISRSIDHENRKDGIRNTMKFLDSGVMTEHDLGMGQLLYIYMVNKMSDGKMKLRRMGITEEQVEAIHRQLDERFVRFADWVQEEYLVDLRNRYNEVHERVFGASMAGIDNYFPLRIDMRDINREDDISNESTEIQLPSAITGSIINRTRNNRALDLNHTDALSVLFEHIQEMEHWAAYAEYIKDVNTLTSYRRFHNQLTSMNTVFGTGEKLFKNFRTAMKISAGAYRPKVSDAEKAANSVARSVATAKISLRLYTAMKQTASITAFMPDVTLKNAAKVTLEPIETWKWCMENLPSFAARWGLKNAGDEKLLPNDKEWKFLKEEFVKKLAEIGLTPNRFVDAVTVSLGARAIYLSKYDSYIQEGYSEEVADERAKQDAEISFNETQQSSENAFLSALQKDRTFVHQCLTVFRNSSFGFTRRSVESMRNLRRMARNGYKEESIAFMTKQLMRDGLTEEQAKTAAEKRYDRALWYNLATLATNTFMNTFLWNLSSHIIYLLFGDDDDKKLSYLKEDALHALFSGWAEGFALGNVVSDKVGNLVAGESPFKFSPTLSPVMSDIDKLFRTMNSDPIAGINDLVNLAFQAGLGVNPQSITDAVVAVIDACNGDLDTSKEAMFLILRVMQVPQSQLEQLYIDEIGTNAAGARKMSYREISRRYAEYKVMQEAPLTGWAYSDEEMKQRIKSEEKTFKKKVNERKEPKKK